MSTAIERVLEKMDTKKEPTILTDVEKISPEEKKLLDNKLRHIRDWLKTLDYDRPQKPIENDHLKGHFVEDAITGENEAYVIRVGAHVEYSYYVSNQIFCILSIKTRNGELSFTNNAGVDNDDDSLYSLAFTRQDQATSLNVLRNPMSKMTKSELGLVLNLVETYEEKVKDKFRERIREERRTQTLLRSDGRRLHSHSQVSHRSQSPGPSIPRRILLKIAGRGGAGKVPLHAS